MKAMRRDLGRRLWPLDSGPADIRALDGLRAIAALSVLTFHAALLGGLNLAFGGVNLNPLWVYLESGVHLFFVLSGFLLFLPYARALLVGRPWPSATRFYKRRALRILPAYWACLAILVAAGFQLYLSPTGAQDVVAHIALVHDEFPLFNRSIQGPFWTLAVEAQFYLVLPLIALGARLVVGSSRSLPRLVAALVTLIALTLAVRQAAALAQSPHATLAGVDLRGLNPLLFIVTGEQGKFLEVFAVGMLCATLYVASTELGVMRWTRARWTGPALVGVALVTALLLAQRVYVLQTDMLSPCYRCLRPTHIGSIGGPLLIGLSYGALLLGILWGGRRLAAPFSAPPLRFLGLISYSLYLWNLPIIMAFVPRLDGLPGGVRLAGVVGVILFALIPFAYLSYQLVERPFLARRQRLAGSAAPPLPAQHAYASQAESR